MSRRSWLAAIGLAWGACAHAPPPVEKAPFAFAVLELGDRETAQGCVMTLLDRGYRVIGRDEIDAALEKPDTTTYKRLGEAVHADLIIDIDDRFAREKHSHKKVMSAVLVSAASGDVLATTPMPLPSKTPFVMGQKVCTELMQQLP